MWATLPSVNYAVPYVNYAVPYVNYAVPSVNYAAKLVRARRAFLSTVIGWAAMPGWRPL